MRERRVKAKIAHRPPARRRRVLFSCLHRRRLYNYLYIYAKLCRAREPYTPSSTCTADRKYLRKRLKRARRRRPLPVFRPDRAEEGGGDGNNQLRDDDYDDYGGGGRAMDACARKPRGGRGRDRWAGLTTIVVVVPFTDYRRPSLNSHAHTEARPSTPPQPTIVAQSACCRRLLSALCHIM